MRFSWILMAWVWLMESAAWPGPSPVTEAVFLGLFSRGEKKRHGKERVTFQNLFILDVFK